MSWNSAPSLAALSSGVVDRISHNYIEYGALPRPRVAGHISVAANAKNVYKSFDVTDAVRRNLRVCSILRAHPQLNIVSPMAGLVKSIANDGISPLLQNKTPLSRSACC